jgi:hypothetical protein
MKRHHQSATEKRINRLARRVDREVYIFPDKHDKSLNRLVKKTKRQKPKTFEQQMREWKVFEEKTK